MRSHEQPPELPPQPLWGQPSTTGTGAPVAAASGWGRGDGVPGQQGQARSSRDRWVAVTAAATLALGAGLAGWRWVGGTSAGAWPGQAQEQLSAVSEQTARVTEASEQWRAQPATLRARRADVQAHLLERLNELASERARLAAGLAAYQQLPVLRARQSADERQARSLGAAAPSAQLAAAAAQVRRDTAAVTAAMGAIDSAKTGEVPDDSSVTAQVLDLVHQAIATPTSPLPPSSPSVAGGVPEVLAAPPPPALDPSPGAVPLASTPPVVIVPGPADITAPPNPGAQAESPPALPGLHVLSPPAAHLPAPPARHSPALPAGPDLPSPAASDTQHHPDHPDSAQSPPAVSSTPTVLAAPPGVSSTSSGSPVVLSPTPVTDQPQTVLPPRTQQPQSRQPVQSETHQPETHQPETHQPETQQPEPQQPEVIEQAPPAPTRITPDTEPSLDTTRSRADSSPELPTEEQVRHYSGSGWVARKSQSPQGQAIMREMFGGSSAHDDSSVSPDGQDHIGAGRTNADSADDSESSGGGHSSSHRSSDRHLPESRDSDDTQRSDSDSRDSDSDSHDSDESGSHDSGSHDSGSHDSGSHDSGSHDSDADD
jgi:hypothetical protein